MDIPRGGRFSGVEIGMGIDPNDAHPLIAHRRDSPNADGMVAAEKDKGFLMFQASARVHIDFVTYTGDAVEMSGLAGIGRLIFRQRDEQVALVPHLITQRAEIVVQPGVTQRAGAHVYPAPPLTKIHRNAEDADVVAHERY